MKSLTLSLICIISNAVCGTVEAWSNEKSKPNFVVFIADDHGQLDSEVYDSADVLTPNTKRLASNGMTFSHAFVASPSCGPSRTAMLTGLWPARNGAEPNHRAKRSDVDSLPPILRTLGYEVAAIGKVAHNVFAKDHGFDYIEGPNQGFSDTQSIAKFLSDRDATKPLCLFVGTRHPHTPWSDTSQYDPTKISLPPTHVDTKETREMRAKYYTDVTKADTLFGEVRTLVREKVAGEILLVFTADHGGPWPFGKWTLYDAGIRIPFIAEWPGHIKPGAKSDAMICLPDLLPTFIELAGGKVPEGIDGKSFAGVLLGSKSDHREQIFSTQSGDGDFNVFPIRCVRTRDWKYIRNLHPEFQQHTHISRSEGPSGREYWQSWLSASEKDPFAKAIVHRYIEHPSEELYDLQLDPYECNNLASNPDQKTRLAALRSELDAWMKQQGDQQTVFGNPLLLNEPVTSIVPGGQKKAK